MRGLEKNRMKRDRHADRQTYIHTYNGHRDSMIESAQWADSMKNQIYEMIEEQLTKFYMLVARKRQGFNLLTVRFVIYM